MIALLFSTPALAWNCQGYFWLDNPSEDHKKRGWCPTNTCRHPPSSSVTYFFRSGDFTAAERTAISDGDEAWNAGPGTALPDATFSFNASSVQISSRSFNDSTSTVSESSPAWFDGSTGLGAGTLAVSVTTISKWPNCEWKATDIVFNSSTPPSSSWCDDLPSNCVESSPVGRSRGGTMMHELGHSFGLAHNDSPVRLNIMNALSPGAGDTAGLFRAQEDEARALVSIKGNGGNNINLMLSRFIFTGTDPDGNVKTEDEWRNGASSTTYGVDRGDLLSSIGSSELLGDEFEGKLNASITGNIASISPVVIKWVWRPLNASWSCANPPASAVMTSRSVGLTNNTPSQLTTPIPLTVPNNAIVGQTYRVCATIDPDDLIPESRSNDNVIYTEHKYMVLQ